MSREFVINNGKMSEPQAAEMLRSLLRDDSIEISRYPVDGTVVIVVNEEDAGERATVVNKLHKALTVLGGAR